MSNVSGAVKSIQDIMRKDVGVDGDAQRISQMVWMIFLKIYDDREEELDLTEDDYRSPIPGKYRWRNWAADREGVTGDALVKFVEELFLTLKTKLPTIGDVGKRAQVIRDVFEDTYNYMKSGTLMRQVVNKINEINFNNTQDRHTFGAIYEQILRDLQSAGNAGEFYTPRAVTKFIIDRLAPRLDEVVLDPACGTGGFLTCTIDHKRQFVKSPEDETLVQSTIRGVEKKALPHMGTFPSRIASRIEFRFGAGGIDMKVLELRPARRVLWQVVDGPKEWIGTTVSWDLRQERDWTIVLFKHEGWKEPVEFMHHCSTKWGSFC